MSILEIGQLISILLAAGTPGMTYYVMGKLHKQQIGHMADNCKICKASLNEKIECLDDSVDKMGVRQKELREKTLPDEYVKRRELDIVHSRIEKYHPAKGGT